MSVKGPQVSSLFALENRSIAEGGLGSSLNSVRFSVGYDSRRKLFIGVEQYMDSDSISYTRIRISQDLVHWSPPTTLNVSGSSTSWDKHKLSYPVFANSNFDSNTELDASQLYILGTGVDGSLNYIKVHIAD